MDIKQAKEEIRRTVLAYTERDALGALRIPMVRQRPLLLMGPPGVGKTAIFYQLAQELGVNLVSYTMTHHTRQSALGLPVLREKTFGGKTYTATEYTMSEILASVHERIEKTGVPTGILFLDEINCVSETLMPAMLQLLQSKQFGTHRLPEGWVIVAAGNPPEYNKSVRDFDVVTLDRVKKIPVEPDLDVWKEYAYKEGIHPAILSYLNLRNSYFYKMETTVEGRKFATPRGWEDLSRIIQVYEQLKKTVDADLILQYIQHPKIAEDFSAYLDLYYKYRDDYGVEEILAGQAKPAVFARLLQAPFDERLSLVSLLLAGLDTRFTASLQADAVADACYAFLRETKKALATLPEDIPDGSAELFSQQIKDYETETQQKRDAGLLGKAELTNRLQVQAALHQWEGELRRANAAGTQEAFDLLRGQFGELADQREATQKTAAAALEAAFDFMEQAFAESQEMVVFVTELTVNPASHQFLTENGCERYFKYNKDLLLDHRKAALQQELAAEQREPLAEITVVERDAPYDPPVRKIDLTKRRSSLESRAFVQVSVVPEQALRIGGPVVRVDIPHAMPVQHGRLAGQHGELPAARVAPPFPVRDHLVQDLSGRMRRRDFVRVSRRVESGHAPLAHVEHDAVGLGSGTEPETDPLDASLRHGRAIQRRDAFDKRDIFPRRPLRGGAAFSGTRTAAAAQQAAKRRGNGQHAFAHVHKIGIPLGYKGTKN